MACCAASASLIAFALRSSGAPRSDTEGRRGEAGLAAAAPPRFWCCWPYVLARIVDATSSTSCLFASSIPYASRTTASVLLVRRAPRRAASEGKIGGSVPVASDAALGEPSPAEAVTAALCAALPDFCLLMARRPGRLSESRGRSYSASSRASKTKRGSRSRLAPDAAVPRVAEKDISPVLPIRRESMIGPTDPGQAPGHSPKGFNRGEASEKASNPGGHVTTQAYRNSGSRVGRRARWECPGCTNAEGSKFK